MKLGQAWIYITERSHPAEWSRMWKALGPNPTEEDPETGETWQYMGTTLADSRRGWVHEFRHRACPSRGGERTYRDVPAAIVYPQGGKG